MGEHVEEEEKEREIMESDREGGARVRETGEVMGIQAETYLD